MRSLIALLASFLLVAVVSAQSDASLVDRFDRADAERDYAQALDAAEAILGRHPEAALWHFHAARMQAQLGRADEALASLSRCAELGFTGIASLEQHGDLDPLRGRAEFEAVFTRVRASAEARLVSFKALAEAHRPESFVPRNLADRLGPGEKPALVVALHGSGGSGAQMICALRPVCQKLGLICVAPDALRPLGSGYSWTYRDESAWLIERTVRDAIAEHGADPGRVILVGFSQGANIALAMAPGGAEPFAALVPVCGHYEPASVPASTTPPPVYLISGERDPWHGTYDAAERDLTRAGARVRKRIVPRMGHDMPGRDELERALVWALGEAPRPAESKGE